MIVSIVISNSCLVEVIDNCTKTRSISMVSKPFGFEVFVVKSAQAVTLSIIVLMCVTINDRTVSKVTDVGLKLHWLKSMRKIERSS